MIALFVTMLEFEQSLLQGFYKSAFKSTNFAINVYSRLLPFSSEVIFYEFFFYLGDNRARVRYSGSGKWKMYGSKTELF